MNLGKKYHNAGISTLERSQIRRGAEEQRFFSAVFAAS